MSEFSPDWPHGWHTRGGAKVFLVGKTADRRFVFENEYGSLLVCLPDGLAVGRWTAGSPADIINAPAPKPEPRKWWVNMWVNDDGDTCTTDWNTLDDADAEDDEGGWHRVACVCITEGDGLEGEQ